MSDVARPPPTILRVIDLETTDDAPAHGGVVEIGWQDLVPGADGLKKLNKTSLPQG